MEINICVPEAKLFIYIIYKGEKSMAFEKLAEIIFPNVEHDREYYFKDRKIVWSED